MPAAELDNRTDLYALGGVLFEMLTSRTVFQADSYEGWAMHHLNTAPIPPSSLRADLADWKGLDALTTRLLSKDREKRPGDFAEVLRLIDVIQHIAPKEPRSGSVQYPSNPRREAPRSSNKSPSH